jgi:hypothetical protein
MEEETLEGNCLFLNQSEIIGFRVDKKEIDDYERN